MTKHHVLAVVPGECIHLPHHHDRSECEVATPSVWEGPNGPIPLTCQTCKGDGYTGMGPWCLRPRCTACVGGAPIIDWQTDTCPRCQSPRPGSHPAVQAGGEVTICPHPWHENDGTVRVSIRPVPILDYPVTGRYAEADDSMPFIVRIPDDAEVPAAGTWRLWLGQGNVHTITLPDDAKPGMFAIIRTEVE